jgi:hypothetical protein
MQAWTKHPNTPESDKLAEVMHVVQLDDGKKIELMARDPVDAMDRARRRFDPNIERRMELARRSYTGRRWKNEEDKREYDRLVAESQIIAQNENRTDRK